MDKKVEYSIMLLLSLIFISAFVLLQIQEQPAAEKVPVTCSKNPEQSRIVLPEPDYRGKVLEDAILERRTMRDYSAEELSIQEISMILWAGQGITDEAGLRAAPSAGATYPIDLYVIPNRIENISCGIYRYVPGEHSLILVKEGEFSEEMYALSYGQAHVRDAATLVVFSATPERTTGKYGEKGMDFIFMEAGHIAQNMLLESVSLDLKAGPVGSFDKNGVDELLGTGESIYLIAVGK